MIEPIGHESESGFEETCVLVDGNDYRPDFHKEEIRRSYKVFHHSLFYVNMLKLEVSILTHMLIIGSN